MRSQFGKIYEVERVVTPEEVYVEMTWRQNFGEDDAAIFDLDKARELGEALVAASEPEPHKHCDCWRD